MTRSDLARRVAVNLGGLLLSFLIARLVFSLTGDAHPYLGLMLAILGGMCVWIVADYMAERQATTRTTTGTLAMRIVVDDQGVDYFEVSPKPGRTWHRVRLQGQTLEAFRELAAAAGVAPKRADVLAFAKIVEHGAGLADAYGLTREVSPEAVEDAFATVRTIVRSLTVDAAAMANAHAAGRHLDVLQRSDLVSQRAHELATAAFVVHAKAVAVRANLVLQNRDR